MSDQPSKAASRIISRAMRSIGGFRQVEALESTGAVAESTVAENVLSSKQISGFKDAVKNSPAHTALLLDVMGKDQLRGKTGAQVAEQGVQLIQAAEAALAEIAKDGAQASLSGPQLSALEAIVRLTGRPSLLIKHGDFEGPLSNEWQHLALDVNRNRIKTTIRSVGRVYAQPKGLKATGWGTGWVAGPGLLVTNRHVVEAFGEPSGTGWKLPEGMRVWIDFVVEEGSAEKREFLVKRIIHVEDKDKGQPDLALLEVETRNAAGEELPPALSIASNKAEVREDEDQVYAVGYPGFDFDQDVAALESYFGGIYNRKRLAPGLIMKLDVASGALEHDCTTLKGASGSCLVRLATNKVIGLHFRGTATIQNLREGKNEAVLMAALASEERLKAYGLHFVL